MPSREVFLERMRNGRQKAAQIKEENGSHLPIGKVKRKKRLASKEAPKMSVVTLDDSFDLAPPNLEKDWHVYIAEEDHGGFEGTYESDLAKTSPTTGGSLYIECKDIRLRNAHHLVSKYQHLLLMRIEDWKHLQREEKEKITSQRQVNSEEDKEQSRQRGIDIIGGSKEGKPINPADWIPR